MLHNIKISTKIRLVALLGLFGMMIVAITILPGLYNMNNQLNNIANQQQILQNNINDTVVAQKNLLSLQQKIKKIKNDANSLTNIIWIVGMVVFIVTMVVSYIIAKYVQESIEEFQNGVLRFFKYLNKETNTIQYLNNKSKDEIGTISKLINKNIDITKHNIEQDQQTIHNTIKVLSEFEKGDLSQRVQISSNNPALLELAEILNKMAQKMETNIDNILSILQKYSKNDYLS